MDSRLFDTTLFNDIAEVTLFDLKGNPIIITSVTRTHSKIYLPLIADGNYILQLKNTETQEFCQIRLFIKSGNVGYY